MGIETNEQITIDPMKGVIPANSYIEIEICFVARSSQKDDKTIPEDKAIMKDDKEDEEIFSKYEVTLLNIDS